MVATTTTELNVSSAGEAVIIEMNVRSNSLHWAQRFAETSSHSDGQEMVSYLLKPTTHYCVQETPLLDSSRVRRILTTPSHHIPLRSISLFHHAVPSEEKSQI
jgi:hypothetical protein